MRFIFKSFENDSVTVGHSPHKRLHSFSIVNSVERLSFIIAHDIFIQIILSTMVKNGRCLQSLVFLCVCYTKSVETTFFQLKFSVPGLNPLVKLSDILKSIANVF